MLLRRADPHGHSYENMETEVLTRLQTRRGSSPLPSRSTATRTDADRPRALCRLRCFARGALWLPFVTLTADARPGRYQNSRQVLHSHKKSHGLLRCVRVESPAEIGNSCYELLDEPSSIRSKLNRSSKAMPFHSRSKHPQSGLAPPLSCKTNASSEVKGRGAGLADQGQGNTFVEAAP